MTIKKILKVPSQTTRISLALLALRITAGSAFMIHGWGKIQNPFGWMGPDAPTPAVFQVLAAVSEFFGGLAWILGLLMPVASFGLICTMAVAVFTHMVLMHDPFVGRGGSYELAAVYLCVALVFEFAGAGKFSMDRKIFGQK